MPVKHSELILQHKYNPACKIQNMQERKLTSRLILVGTVFLMPARWLQPVPLLIQQRQSIPIQELSESASGLCCKHSPNQIPVWEICPVQTKLCARPATLSGLYTEYTSSPFIYLLYAEPAEACLLSLGIY